MWKPIKAGTKVPFTNGTVHVRLATQGAVYSADKSGGNQSLLGSGLMVKAKGVQGEVLMTTADGQFFDPAPPTTRCVGVPFTNAEKRQGYSVEEAAVTLALRRLKKEKNDFLRESKAMFDEMQRERKELGLQETAPEEPEQPAEPVVDDSPPAETETTPAA